MTDAVRGTAADPLLRVNYHHLARLFATGWWRPVLGSVLVVGGTLAAGIVIYGAALVGGQVADLPRDRYDTPILPPLADTAAALAAVAVALPIVLLVARLVQARPAGTLSSVVGRLRWRWLGWCLLLALGAMVAFIAGSYALAPFLEPEADGGAWVGAGPFLSGFVVLLALVPFQAAAEEYVFRGWLLQSVGAFVRSPWPAIAVQAVLFAAVHGWGTLWGFVDLVVWATLMGWLTVRTGGLEAAIALHTMNNVTSMAYGVAFGILDLDVTAADMSLVTVLLDLPVIAGYTLAALWLARRHRLTTAAVVPPPPVDHGPDGSAPVDDGPDRSAGTGRTM